MFVEQGAGGNDQLLATVQDAPDLGRRHPSEHPLAERFHDAAPFDERREEEPGFRTAVVLGDDEVLGHVHQTAGQVPGIGGLERGVGQPLRAPWVEMKYWRTSRPSRKFALIGVSMIEPSGFAISPRIPAS